MRRVACTLLSMALALPAAAADPIVSVTLAAGKPRKPLVGFLDGLEAATPPPAALYKPLLPFIWRGAEAYKTTNPQTPIAWARSIGASIDFVTNFPYGGNAPYGGPRPGWKQWSPGGNGAPPYHDENAPDFTAYKAFLDTVIAQESGKRVDLWEFWNEPDQTYSWPQDGANGCTTLTTPSKHQALLFQTYAAFYAELRAKLPAAKLVAPSLSVYCPAFLDLFFAFVKAQGLKVDVLSWHELSAAQQDPSVIAAHLKDARQRYLTGQPYGVQEIYVNETMGPLVTYDPGDAVASLMFLEEGKADRAGRSCFFDTGSPASANPSGCSNGSLDSTLVPGGTAAPAKKRASWWIYSTYQQLARQRIDCRAGQGLACIAGAEGRIITLLIGNWGASAGGTLEIDGLAPVGGKPVAQAEVRGLSLSALPKCGFPASADQSCLQGVQPAAAFDVTVPVSGGKARASLPVNLHDALIVTVTPLLAPPSVGPQKPPSSERPAGTVQR